MRVLKPGETQQPSSFKRARKSDEFSEHERTIILQLAQGSGRKIEDMSETELAKTIEYFGNLHSHCLDPENYPPEVVQIFEGMYTVPVFLMFERSEKEFGASLEEDFKDDVE